jgi:iron complex outermembrane receptor protein
MHSAAANHFIFSSLARVRGLLVVAVVLTCSLAKFSGAQTAPQSSAPDAQKTVQDTHKPAPVTTTVVVHGEVADDYLPESIVVGTLSGTPVKSAPLSVSAVTRDLLNDQQARLLSEVVKNDASVGEDYAPVGYYGVFQIREFSIDLASGLEINGLTIAGEQDVPLENKERVEFLKGPAGGLINYVTKRPALVEAADVATDHRGAAYGAVDLGRFFGSAKQVGARLNLAGEHIESYVKGAEGWRAVGAGAADWKISPRAIWKNDFEYQHKRERSECGYQLLGGTVVPEINRLSPSTMLGWQSWAKPNIFDAFNAGSRLDYDLPHAWKTFAAASYSHSLIDDNTIYPYGNSVANPDYFFAPDGTYDIYDYRNPGELRIDAQAEAIVAGRAKTGAITHELAAGGEIFLRSVQMPKKSVNEWIGSENIYQPIQPVDMESPRVFAKPRELKEDNHQAALILQDRISLPGHVQLTAGGRYDSLRDHNYSALLNSDKPVWLPQFAATYTPIENLTLYGNYGVLLSLGQQAPWWVDNDEQYLAPFYTRQAEVGAKYQLEQGILISAALFRMRAPFFYPKVIQAPDAVCTASEFSAPGDLCFEASGHETHDGVELSAEGKAARWLRLNASLAAIQATGDNTGTPAYDGKQVINAPRVHTALSADLLLPGARGLHLLPGWSYTDRKEATRDDTVGVGGYNLFNLGARYTPGGEQGRVTFRIYADNIIDKRYWKDTGANYGDTFIHLGAPTTVRLSAHYRF